MNIHCLHITAAPPPHCPQALPTLHCFALLTDAFHYFCCLPSFLFASADCCGSPIFRRLSPAHHALPPARWPFMRQSATLQMLADEARRDVSGCPFFLRRSSFPPSLGMPERPPLFAAASY